MSAATEDRTRLAAELMWRIEANLSDAERMRTELHRDPRLSGMEEPAAEWIAERMPMPMERVAQTGRIGRIGPADGPSIALRAELDALPVIEATGAPFASTNGAMHACGHDVHQAALIAVVRAAAELDLPYAMVPFLQPREEAYPSGADEVMSSGALQRHSVRAVIGAHVHPRIPVGSAATGKGPTNAAADEVSIFVHGRGGHGAYPHEAANPIPVLGQLVTGLEEVVRRTVSPMHPAVLTVGHIHAGEAANVIPETGRLSATLRTMNRADRPRVHAAIRRYAESLAVAYGVAAEVVFTVGEPVLENDAHLVDLVDERLRAAGISVSEPMRSCGADDFSFYSERLPSVMAFVGVETPGAEPQPSLHHASFLPDDDAVRRTALVLASAYLGACDLLDGEHGGTEPDHDRA